MLSTLPRWTHRSSSLITFIVAAIVTAAGITWAATTDNLTPTNNYSYACNEPGDGGVGARVCRTDNAQVSYYADSAGDNQLEAGDFDTLVNMMSAEYQPTDLSVSVTFSPSFSGSSETDIIYQEQGVPGSNEGITWCNDAAGTFECDQQYVRIEGAGSYTPGLTCHETGHAVGLLHGQNASPALGNQNSALGCMKKETSYGDRLGANNKENINGAY
ncbi:hypothetical protein [Streptomyces mesophilus]|uniref:hypothetical protein n=1 Tax=Streptomyces mesophilus TaxID=1775132 RepID=UPI0019D051E5|nr:hypothetical protein [Streptomyces mesophilus]